LRAEQARELLAKGEALVCHALFVAARLRARPTTPLFDVLELFAFVKPGVPCLPSPLGLARALRLPEPHTPEDSARVLVHAASALLDALARLPLEEADRARKTAAVMARAGWRWGQSVLAVVGEPEKIASPLTGLDAWRALPQWEEDVPTGKPGQRPVEVSDAQTRLHALVRGHGLARRQQQDFTEAAVLAFSPRMRAGSPRIALAEAGTGTGKTLAYLVPALLSGRKVVVSTGTKTLRETALALSGWQSRRLFGVDLSLRRETTVSDFTRHKDAVSEAERRRGGESEHVAPHGGEQRHADRQDVDRLGGLPSRIRRSSWSLRVTGTRRVTFGQ
jgi:ATP-dependent DNA helicase DinG